MLFVFYFCNNSLNHLGYVALNGSIISEWWTGKDAEGRVMGSSRYEPGIYLVGLRPTTKASVW